MQVIPYAYRQVSFPDAAHPHDQFPHLFSPDDKVYEVTMYFIFDGVKLHSFRKQYDMLENAALLDELKVSYKMSRFKFLVYPGRFDEIYKEIRDYENVPKTDSHKKC